MTRKYKSEARDMHFREMAKYVILLQETKASSGFPLD